MAFSEGLALRVSRPVADRLCEQAAREGKGLLEVARADAEVKKLVAAKELEALFQAARYFGGAAAMIERVLADWTSARETAA